MASKAATRVLLVEVEALAVVAVAATVRSQQHVVLAVVEGDLVTEPVDLAAVVVALMMELMMNLEKTEEALVQRSVVALVAVVLEEEEEEEEEGGVDFQEVMMEKMVVGEEVDLVAVVVTGREVVDGTLAGKKGTLQKNTPAGKVVVEVEVEVEEGVIVVVKKGILLESVRLKSKRKVSTFFKRLKIKEKLRTLYTKSMIFLPSLLLYQFNTLTPRSNLSFSLLSTIQFS